MALKFHFNFIPIVVSEASTKEYQEYLPAEVLEAGIKAVREREELLLIMMINFYQHSFTNAYYKIALLAANYSMID